MTMWSKFLVALGFRRGPRDVTWREATLRQRTTLVVVMAVGFALAWLLSVYGRW